MANITYPPFGKVKTIVLPVKNIPYGSSIEEYKELFGIDLKDFIELDEDGYINFKPKPNDFYLLQCEILGGGFVLLPIATVGRTKYVFGNTDGDLSLQGIENSEGIVFWVDSSDDFTLENVKIADFNQY